MLMLCFWTVDTQNGQWHSLENFCFLYVNVYVCVCVRTDASMGKYVWTCMLRLEVKLWCHFSEAISLILRGRGAESSLSNLQIASGPPFSASLAME